MSEWKITHRRIVYPWHCDHMGHVNVMWYAGKFDEACWQLLSMLGSGRPRRRGREVFYGSCHYGRIDTVRYPA
jgi:acyl-CoA thioesterase FadM